MCAISLLAMGAAVLHLWLAIEQCSRCALCLSPITSCPFILSALRVQATAAACWLLAAPSLQIIKSANLEALVH